MYVSLWVLYSAKETFRHGVFAWSMPPADDDMPQANGDDEEGEGNGLVACRLEFADVIEYRLFKVRWPFLLHIDIGRIGSSSEEERLGR